MTCGRKDWEPASEEIPVRASQTDACTLEHVHRFIFYSSLRTGLAMRNVPEATVTAARLILISVKILDT